MTAENSSDKTARGTLPKMTDEIREWHRAISSLGGKAVQALKSPERRRLDALKAWEVRRLRYGPTGRTRYRKKRVKPWKE